MDSLNIGTIDLCLDTPGLRPSLTDDERRTHISELLDLLQARISTRNYPFEVRFDILNTQAGCIKARVIVTLCFFLAAADYVSKYKNFRESIPLMYDDGKAVVECMIRGQKFGCSAWLQGGDVAEFVHVVKPGDTLSEIVAKWNIRPFTSNQVMIATFRQNPHAFIDKNIDRIRVGAVISSPTRSSLKGIPG